MSTSRSVGVLVGSLRAASLSRKTALALRSLAPAELSLQIVELGDLPLYNDDLEAQVPPAWARFRAELAAVEAVLFVSPEYNRSVPGVLKNAVDVGSRPYGKSIFAGKPAAIVSVSPGALGAFGANHHLRQSLVFLDMPCMQQPEAYVNNAASLFDENGTLIREESRAFLTGFIKAFVAWVERFAEGPRPAPR
jgi:chromate reductase